MTKVAILPEPTEIEQSRCARDFAQLAIGA